MGARSLIEAGATALASWGMAGGLDPALSAGAILLPSEVLGPDGRIVNYRAGLAQPVERCGRGTCPGRAAAGF